MKTVLIFIAFSLLYSCKSRAVSPFNKKPSEKDTIAVHPCKNLENGTIYVYKNAGLQTKTDRNGQFYTNIEAGKKLVIEIVYDKKAPEGTMDGGYKEIIAFEVPDEVKHIELTNNELQQTKMVFARYCFCKDANRFLPVSKGHLNLIRKGNNLSIRLDFSMKKSKHVVNQIDETVVLK